MDRMWSSHRDNEETVAVVDSATAAISVQQELTVNFISIFSRGFPFLYLV